MLERKERENETSDILDLGEKATLDALKNSGLLKIFFCPNMRVQPLLLEQSISMWDPDS